MFVFVFLVIVISCVYLWDRGCDFCNSLRGLGIALSFDAVSNDLLVEAGEQASKLE